MQVTLLTSLAGTGWTRNAGDLHDCTEAEAAALIAAGFAVPVRVEPAVVETADLSGDQETATLQPKNVRPSRRRGGGA